MSYFDHFKFLGLPSEETLSIDQVLDAANKKREMIVATSGKNIATMRCQLAQVQSSIRVLLTKDEFRRWYISYRIRRLTNHLPQDYDVVAKKDPSDKILLPEKQIANASDKELFGSLLASANKSTYLYNWPVELVEKELLNRLYTKSIINEVSTHRRLPRGLR